jgi:hypothetical protein
MFGQTRREKVKVSLAVKFVVGRKTNARQKTLIHEKQTVVRILNEKGNTGNIFEEDENLHGITILLSKPFSDTTRFKWAHFMMILTRLFFFN